MSELLNLASRCEQATGPDRVLDVLIAQAIGFSVGDLTVEKLLSYSPHNTIEEIAKWASGDPVPFFVFRYTGNLHDATSLFPPNALYRSGHAAEKADPSMFFCDAVTEDGRDFHALAETEEGARISASLRARAADKGEL